MPGKKIHVVPYGGSWAVKREGASRASGVFDTKKDAIEEARKIAWRNNDEVILHNSKGHITKGKRSGKNPDDDNCFITTACMRYYNLPDNCYQLSTLRKFRDSYMRSSDDGNNLISQYYSIAPKIVKLLNSHSDRKKFYKRIFRKINSACALIERGKPQEAQNLYRKIVTSLTKYFQLR